VIREYLERFAKAAYDLCNIRPSELGEIVPEELFFMLEIASERKKQEDYKWDLRIARICGNIAEPYRDRKGHPKPYTVWEFMPGNHEEKKSKLEDQSVEDMLSMVQIAQEAFRKD
jgi:hypothetical protein